jgi:uncharacterized membrane protein (GlpM family)
MDGQSTTRLRAAVAAAWWTILIFVIYLTVAWFGLLWAFCARPDWLLRLWGGPPLMWEQMQTISLWLFGVMKLILYVAVLITLWLTLYARRLGRQG